MNASALAALLQSPHPPLLLHVMPPEHFSARRIAEARNACVYETAFVENVRSLAPNPAQAIVVYGEGAPSLDSEEAADQLRRSGYIAVTDFRGGLREWDAAGMPVISEAPLPLPPALSGVFEADTRTSVIRWTGRNLFNFHHGHLGLAGGRIEWHGGAIQSAAFTIDLKTIACEDLADSAYNAMLIRHLRSPDFLDVEKNPTARFEATHVEPVPNASEGTPNFLVTGNLTFRGVSREIHFPAVIAAADAGHVTAQAVFEIDRTRWGSRYGSGKFFAFLGKHVVNDHVALHLKIAAAAIPRP